MKIKDKIFSGLRKRIAGRHETVTPAATDRLRLSGKGIRIPLQGTSFAIEMGKQTLHLCADLPVDDQLRKPPFDFILFDPDLFYSGISQTLRLVPGQKIAVDYRDESQKLVFSHTREAFRRHLQITHEGDSLVFRDPISELGTYVSLLAEEQPKSRFETHRLHNVERIISHFGGPIEILPPEKALELLKEVNLLLMTSCAGVGKPNPALFLPIVIFSTPKEF